jgi:hypothetical protein
VSFCRRLFGSDLYIWPAGLDGELNAYCCMDCPMRTVGQSPHFYCNTAAEMVEHVKQHRAVMDSVPSFVEEKILDWVEESEQIRREEKEKKG